MNYEMYHLPETSTKYWLSTMLLPSTPTVPGPVAASKTLADNTIPAISPKPRPPTK